jgi:LmbE family N-acetylglucosaminyl deacetylase
MEGAMKCIARRDMLGLFTSVAGAATMGLPLVGQSKKGDPVTGRKLRVVVAGAHPDDPEFGCGGTAALYADLSHEVVILYLTRGEAGIHGKSHEEAAAIRTDESQKACKILKVRPMFAGQIDGSTEINSTRYEEFRKILEAENPDIVFTHWPIDTHPDHRVTSLLVYDAWKNSDKKFALYYYEVVTGFETQHFYPTDYVDITATEARRRAASFAHVSQRIDHWYPVQDLISQFRGNESGHKYSEAFVRHVQSSYASLPR